MCFSVENKHSLCYYITVSLWIFIYPYPFLIVYFQNTTTKWEITKLGEHPAAMQRGCANARRNFSILLYILSLSFFIQYLNRVLSTFVVYCTISPSKKTIKRLSTARNDHFMLDLTRTSSFLKSSSCISDNGVVSFR